MRLALDHLTAVDATPAMLVDQAAAAGCGGVCLFLQPMAVLPLMPHFDIIADRAARRALKQRMDRCGVALDLAYPFTLSARSEAEGFAPLLDCAAELDARLLNVLVYDRDPARRVDRFGEFCTQAAGFGLRVAVEFYPASQVPSLGDALELVAAVGRPGEVGVNVDLLHLMRSGGTLAELAAAPAQAILFGQFADGPARREPAEWELEASTDRLIAGQGAFDLAGFARALPAGCPVSVEIPRNARVEAGVPLGERVRAAVESVRRALAA